MIRSKNFPLYSTGPSRTLRRRLALAGIPTLNTVPLLPVYAVDSDEFQKILEYISDDQLGDGQLVARFYHSPCDDEIALIDLMEDEHFDPFDELTVAILKGLECSWIPQKPTANLDTAFYQLKPVKEALRKIVNTLQHPPVDTCPNCYPVPVGTYMSNVRFELGNWVFEITVYRC